MRTNIVPIGSSQGILIPKVLLEQTRLGKEVELVVDNGNIVIKPVTDPRQGWAEQFAWMAKNEDDQLLDDVQKSDWDTDEWEW